MQRCKADFFHECVIGIGFYRIPGGISHSNQEFTRMEDIEKAANALLQAVLQLDQEK